jgi:hypothetical protein
MLNRKVSNACLAGIMVILTLLFVTACIKPTYPDDTTGVVSGTVSAADRTALADVTVSIGTVVTTTDGNGHFILPAITPGENVLVNFAKDGYVPLQKTVTVSKNNTSYITCSMFVPFVSTFAVAGGFSIGYNGAGIDVPASAFVTPGGSVFSGDVRTEMIYFDPTVAQNLEAFPGSFTGVQTNGDETMFESYGFLYASFSDAADPDVELSLASGKTALISVPIPAALAANAPDTMPLWYYDDSTGEWIEQGSATKGGDFYFGNVSHFSYWNFDHPITITDQSTLTGTVIAEDGKSVVPGAQVAAYGVNYSGYTRTNADANGEFSIIVKASAQVRLQAFAGENMSPQTDVINTPASGGSTDVGTLTVADLSFTVIGKLVDTEGDPITAGQGMISQVNPPTDVMPFQEWIGVDAEGNFHVTSNYTGTQPSITVRVQMMTRGTVYSNNLTLVLPQPGQIRNMGNITMHPAGKIKGRAKTSDNEWIANKWVSFNQQGSTGEGTFFSATSDSLGYFTLEGPPNSNFSNMKGSTYIESSSYQTGTMSLSFPASGSTNNIGTVVFSPQTK